MPPDLERTLRDVPRRFPRPSRGTTATALQELTATFARPQRPSRRRIRWAVVLAALGAGVFGAVAWAVVLQAPSEDPRFPRPVYRSGTFVCPRYSPGFNVEVGSASGNIYGQSSTKGAPISLGGSVIYGQVGAKNAGVARVCRRITRRPTMLARGFNDSYWVPVTESSYAQYKSFNCLVRGRVLVRFTLMRKNGRRIGTQLDIGVEGRRNLIARIVAREHRGTIRTSPVCL